MLMHRILAGRVMRVCGLIGNDLNERKEEIMETKIEADTKVTLTLNLQEALYLKGLVQNPLCDPADEDSDTKELRRKFWDALIEVNF